MLALIATGSAQAEIPASTVPDFFRLDVSAAESLAEEAGIELVIRRLDAHFRPNLVMDQTPSAGAILGEDRRVNIVVSDGRVVPNFLGRPQAQVTAELDRLGISWEVTTRRVAGIEAGMVGEVAPSVGARIDPTREVVYLIVSTIPFTTIPSDLVGLRHGEAVERLERLGFRVSFDREINMNSRGNCYAVGRYVYSVTGSNPRPGARVESGRRVTLRLRERYQLDIIEECPNTPRR